MAKPGGPIRIARSCGVCRGVHYVAGCPGPKKFLGFTLRPIKPTTR